MMELYEMLFDKKEDNLEWTFGAGAQISKRAFAVARDLVSA